MAETDLGLDGWEQGSYDRAPCRYSLRSSVAELRQGGGKEISRLAMRNDD